jgi:archaemetzincin
MCSRNIGPYPRLSTYLSALLVCTTFGCGHAKSHLEKQVLNLTLQPLGKVSKANIQQVGTTLNRTFNVRLSIEKPIPFPKQDWYAPRKRWLADPIVATPTKERTLYLASVDISRPAHGQANFGVLGCANGNAIVSTFRMKGNKDLLDKIAIHEIGHTFGLPHCPNKGCIMQDLVGHASTLDGSTTFCPSCRAKIGQWLK